MIKIYEALSFAANCRAAETTLLGPGAWNADMWYNSNCERTFLPKYSQEQIRILYSAFILIVCILQMLLSKAIQVIRFYCQ